MRKILLYCSLFFFISSLTYAANDSQSRPRAREVGLVVGVFNTGKFNAIKVFLCESSGGIAVENSKHLTTGDGGIITCDDEILGDKMRKFSCEYR